MKKLINIIILLILIFPISISGMCTDSEIVKMNKLAGNIKITPIFDDNTEKYNLIISNLSPLLYFMDIEKQTTYNYITNEIILYNYEPNKSYRFKFYSNNPNCYGNNVISKYITMPGYNKWYKEPICSGLERESFCQKWNKNVYSAEEIVKLVEDYKNNKDIIKEEDNDKKVYGFYDYIIEFYQKYYLFILPTVIVILTSFIIWKRNKDSSLF